MCLHFYGFPTKIYIVEPLGCQKALTRLDISSLIQLRNAIALKKTLIFRKNRIQKIFFFKKANFFKL